MNKITSEEFIDRFVECLEKGEDFRLEDCIVEGDVNILDIYGRIKEKIKDKKAVHSSLGAAFFLNDYKHMKGNGNIDEYSSTHPIVRTHPETRKKILFVNWTYTKKIIGLSQKESDEILTKIFEHQARLELTCRFTWTENTVCIWDNRSVIHFAIADFYPGRGLGHERIMDRIAIEGDQPH